MALASSFRPWRTTTAARIQAVGSSQPPSWAAFNREAAAFLATNPTRSPELAASSDASEHLSRSTLHSYHNTSFFYIQENQANFRLGICITSRATSVSTHRDPRNIFLLSFAIKQNLFNKTLPFQVIVIISPALTNVNYNPTTYPFAVMGRWITSMCA
jgi:hypothetical protein